MIFRQTSPRVRVLNREIRDLKIARKGAWHRYLKELQTGYPTLAEGTKKAILMVDREISIRSQELDDLLQSS